MHPLNRRWGWLIPLLFLFTLSARPPHVTETVDFQIGQTVHHNPNPAEAGRLLVDDLLSREHMFYGNYGLHYSEACAAVGALRFSEIQADQMKIEQLVKRYEALLDDSSDLISKRPHVDQFVIGIVPLEIYRLTGDETWLKQGLSFADSQWDSTIEGGLTAQTRWWIDDMYMVGMLQTQAYRITNEKVYLDRAARQLNAYLEKLQKENGLFYHGPEFPYFWGRGNGWVASALAEVLCDLPQSHPLQPKILNHYRLMMDALLKYQSENGMWRQLIDYPYAWTESSCTAMFAYAMAVGVNRGWLNKPEYREAVEKSWKALSAHIDRAGKVREICVGTGQENDIEFYLKRPRHEGDFHGQAPVLWLISELLREGSRFKETL
jgi:unsaturated rhamnogalacturonyl hydrolase